jgi:Periplasmic binding protein
MADERKGAAGRCMRRWAGAAMACAALAGAGPAGALTIGAIVPQSWPNPTQAEEMVLGMQLAIKLWPGAPVPTLVVKDSACDPRKAEAAARELLAAKVDGVVGSFCAIGTAPKLVAEAGLPYVSAHAERLPKAPDGVLQLGRVELYVAERIASALRQETGLRVSARTACWMDFEPVLRSDQYDAILCPALGYDKARWEQAEATFTAAHRRPFTQSVARGYAAMEAALTTLRRGRQIGRSTDPIPTVLGAVPRVDAPAAPDAMQLVLAPKLPKLSPKEQAAVDLLLKTKACPANGDLAATRQGPWGEHAFVVRGLAPACPVLSSASRR